MNEYEYTIENVKFLDKLHSYIQDIFPTYNFHIDIHEKIKIIFTNELSQNEITLLETSIANYNPPQYTHVISKNENVNITNNKTNNTIYSTISTYLYSSSDDFIDKMKVISYMNTSTNNSYYKIRIYDITNDIVITESNELNNTNLEIIEFSDLEYNSTQDTILQIQIKVSNTNTFAYVQNINFTYSKQIE